MEHFGSAPLVKHVDLILQEDILLVLAFSSPLA
jgi:hypothetical protein